MQGAPGGAALGMIRKSKLKEVKKLMDQMTEDPTQTPELERFAEFLKTRSISNIDYIGNKHECFFTLMSDRHRTINVAAEYNLKAKTGFVLGMPNPDIMGGVLRDSGARAIIVSMDKRMGGVSPREFARFAREQQRAQKFNPGPIAIVWHEFVVDTIQVDFAASQGAAAITLFPEVNDGDVTGLIKQSFSAGIEPIIMVKSKDDVDKALVAGARCICTHGLTERDALTLREQYTQADRGAFSDILWGSKLQASSEFSSIEEIDASWVLRDGGFNFVWPTCDALYSMGMEDVYSTVLAMKSKASKNFISPRQFLMDRKKEGAKEHLGDLAM